MSGSADIEVGHRAREREGHDNDIPAAEQIQS